MHVLLFSFKWRLILIKCTRPMLLSMSLFTSCVSCQKIGVHNSVYLFVSRVVIACAGRGLLTGAGLVVGDGVSPSTRNAPEEGVQSPTVTPTAFPPLDDILRSIRCRSNHCNKFCTSLCFIVFGGVCTTAPETRVAGYGIHCIHVFFGNHKYCIT